MSAGRILVYDQTSALAAQLRVVAQRLDPVPEVLQCGRPEALAELLVAQELDVLVAGPGMDTRAGWERLRVIREEVPEMALVLVVEGSSVTVRDVVRAGAVDLVELPLAPDLAAAALERAVAIAQRTRAATRPPADEPASVATTAGPVVDDAELWAAVAPGGEDAVFAGATPDPSAVDGPLEGVELAKRRSAGDDAPPGAGRVITVASASGGCGKTFLATNLAWLLHRRGGRRVCIVDLDLQFGQVCSTLRLRPTTTIIDLLQAGIEAGGDLASVLDDHLTVHDSGIAVLAPPQDPTDAQLVHPIDVGRVIDAVRSRFDDVVLDTPAALTDTVVTALDRAEEILVMGTLDVSSVRSMHVLLGTLDRLGLVTDDVHLVLNRAEAEAGIETTQILTLFPQGFDATLPHSREVTRAVNAGRPVLDASPDAPVSTQLEAALRRLLPDEARAAAEARERARPPRPWRRPRRVREMAS